MRIDKHCYGLLAMVTSSQREQIHYLLAAERAARVAGPKEGRSTAMIANGSRILSDLDWRVR